MNKGKKIILALAVFTFALVGIWGTFSVIEAGKTKVILSEPAVYSAESKASQTKSLYMIKEHMGNIGVFQNVGKDYVLVNIINTNLSLLPEADVCSLKEGIYLENEKQVIMLIEDFTS